MDAQGFGENKDAAKKGGHVAGGAREQLEMETGKRVISKRNALDLVERKRISN